MRKILWGTQFPSELEMCITLSQKNNDNEGKCLLARISGRRRFLGASPTGDLSFHHSVVDRHCPVLILIIEGFDRWVLNPCHRMSQKRMHFMGEY